MAILDIEHPDIVDFIECKLLEDKKAQALMREGYDGTTVLTARRTLRCSIRMPTTRCA